MSPVYYSVKKGEIIARAGDRATRHQVDLINSYYETLSQMDNLPRMVGIVSIVLLSLAIFSLAFRIVGGRQHISAKNLLLIMTATTVTLILVKGGVVIGEVVETRYSDLPRQIYAYMLPIALSSMLVGILINFETGLLAGLLTSLFASIMMQGNLYYFCFAMLGSVIASLPISRFESRYSLLIHGLKISLVNLPVVVIIYLIEKNRVGSINWPEIVSAAMGGLLTAVIASIVLPFFESLFDITTNLKLLELSNMNHPALKELIFKAPGTYQHAIVVGNLAESGASKIGANPLLARVAAYYHDIGKAENAEYFVENQSPHSGNIHDRLDPFESARIIIAHLEKGLRIADKYRLGTAIKNILQQHHGTRLVEFFYHKALAQSNQNQSAREISENHFRYDGPQPQSLEAAIVMLADISEAATRSIDTPTESSISDMVKKVCWKALEDGQLNQSGLTLQTYHLIVEVFSKMLITIHHHRIKYPEPEPAAQTNTPNLITAR